MDGDKSKARFNKTQRFVTSVGISASSSLSSQEARGKRNTQLGAPMSKGRQVFLKKRAVEAKY